MLKGLIILLVMASFATEAQSAPSEQKRQPSQDSDGWCLWNRMADATGIPGLVRVWPAGMYKQCREGWVLRGYDLFKGYLVPAKK